MRRTGTLLLIIVLVLAGVTLFSTYNRLVAMDEAVTGQWAQVENQLQRRYELIPNLVETVRGYAAHEEEIFTAVAEARTRLAGAATPEEQVAAANQVESALGRLLVIVENYPDLKADQQFRQLMDELAGTENRIAVERQRFNELVRDYNTVIRRMPMAVIARLMGFGPKEYFEAAPGAETAPQVEF